MEDKNYDINELAGLSDRELIDRLKNSWGVSGNQIEVIGQIELVDNAPFGFLNNVRLIGEKSTLVYPLKNETKPCSFYINPGDANKYGDKKSHRMVTCILELSPESERLKRNNPLAMCVSPGSCTPLVQLPEEMDIDIFSPDDKRAYISKSIFDFYKDKSEIEIGEIRKQQESEIVQQREKAEMALADLKSEQSLLEEKRDSSIRVNQLLVKKKKDLDTELDSLSHEKDLRVEALAQLNTDFDRIEKEMTHRISRLKKYVKDKATFLQTFELAEQEDLDAFLQNSDNEVERSGLSFKDFLGGDYQKAVSYIQAHLVTNDFLYPRHIIENYLTLLRTKDLIVLAGESGSGKTNLIKSFAKTVGGKSIIIPVKPNWTSSEDLLGYYNPLEKKYIATPFLEALLEARQNPNIPYFICLDEMNLARVEYYFADFLSLLETRNEEPEITLYVEDESSHVLAELKAVVEVINEGKQKYNQDGIVNFVELLKDENLNTHLRQAFGFGDKDSLIKYHGEIRRMLSGVMAMPSSITMPENVHIIGAINIDETTHYLSPKILDRAHIMRFESPLLSDWDEILAEVESYGFDDVSGPLLFEINELGFRSEYPRFDRDSAFCRLFVELNSEFFHKLGIDFGMRTIRQGLNYLELFLQVHDNETQAINNFILHKVLPKFTLDGNKTIGQHTKLDLIETVLSERIKREVPDFENMPKIFSAVAAIDRLVLDAKSNDGVVNFWS